jgi:hypothetical protein
VEHSTPRFLLLGKLTRDFIILPNGKTLLDVSGGNVLYASIGLLIWEPEAKPGIVARVGEDYSQSWLNDFSDWGIDVRGVKILPRAVDVRSFSTFTDFATRFQDDPVTHFARLEQPFPKALLGYRVSNSKLDSRTVLLPTSLRQDDIPSEFMDTTTAHLCPIDFLSHSVLPAILRQSDFIIVTLDPSPGYMNPSSWDDLPAMLTGLTAFLPSEEELRSLFQGRSTDLWEMAEALTVYGCELVVIKRGINGQLLYDSSTRTRWEIPPYPTRMVNPVGAGDGFCGGFLTAFKRTYDPLEAALHGNISASLIIEGDPPNYALEALPGLAQARLEALRASVRKL